MTATELVSKAKDLRLASNAAMQLVGLLDNPDAGNDEVVEVLKYDNVLTAKLLRACNSSYFGFSDPVASVEQAVLLIGHQQILQIVLALEFSPAMTVSLPGYAVEAKELWQHSLATASAAEVLAKGGLDIDVEPSVAFTAGLLHDTGKLLMSQVLTAELQTQIRDRISADRISRDHAERLILGTDHAEVGGVLLETWRFPEEIIEAVRNHHHPVVQPKPRLSAVIHVANVVAHLAGSAPGWEAYAVSIEPHVAEEFSLTNDKLEMLVLNVRETFDRVDQLMAMS
jgi:putative nucleotidyltransferase with HDIG domain